MSLMVVKIRGNNNFNLMILCDIMHGNGGMVKNNKHVIQGREEKQ